MNEEIKKQALEAIKVLEKKIGVPEIEELKKVFFKMERDLDRSREANDKLRNKIKVLK